MTFSLSVKEFAKEVVEFRQHMGRRQFWEMPELHRDGAVRGLTQAYLSVDPDADPEFPFAVTIFRAALDEFDARAEMWDRISLAKRA